MIDIWIYKPANLGQQWIVKQVDPDPEPAEPAKVIELDAYREEAWWSGYAACQCAHLIVAVIKGAEPPDAVPCPRCKQKTSVPEVHWHASTEAWCNCGHVWKIVMMAKTDILPTTVDCRRCGNKTKDLRPWPYTN